MLRTRSGISVVEQEQSWLIAIPKGHDFVCEVTIPHSVLEWFASVKQDGQETWSDWMDYTGYDDSPMEKLEAEMADDILSFIERVSTTEHVFPLSIWEERN